MLDDLHWLIYLEDSICFRYW